MPEPKLVRCLWTDCYELFESPDPKHIRICDKCRKKFEKARTQYRQEYRYEWHEEFDDRGDESLHEWLKDHQIRVKKRR